MTMFSMKPKFNLAEFLAEPAPVGAARSRGARRRAMKFQDGATPKDSASSTPPETPGSSDKPEK